MKVVINIQDSNSDTGKLILTSSEDSTKVFISLEKVYEDVLIDISELRSALRKLAMKD